MLSLNLSLTENKALNQDGITALRSLSLVQGQTYPVSVSLFSGSSLIAPVVSNFSFVLSDNRGTSLVSLNSITPNGSGYVFNLPLTSPALGFSSSYSGSVSFSANGNAEIIEPFNIALASAAFNGNTAGYVSSLNNLSSDVILAGGGSVSISQFGQTITISGNGGGGVGTSSGSYYPLGSNPSGYLTSFALSPYALQSALNATGTGLQGQINTLYPRSNPSGYLSSIPPDVVRTSGTQTIGGVKTFSAQAFFPSGANGVFYGDGSHLTGLPGDTSNAVLLTGDQTLLGIKSLDASGMNIAAGWTASLTLTKFVDNPATPATLTLLNSVYPLDGFVDGDTLTITDDIADSFVYEFDSDGSVADGHILIDITSHDVATIFGEVYTNPGPGGINANWSLVGSDFQMVGETVGSAGFIEATGTFQGTPFDISAAGTDDSSTGTRLVASSLPTGRPLYITSAIAFCEGATWTDADIEIGYGTSDDDFQRALQLPLASITSGSHYFPTDITAPTESDAQVFTNPPAGLNIIAREASSGGPIEETTGDNVIIYLRGLYF